MFTDEETQYIGQRLKENSLQISALMQFNSDAVNSANFRWKNPIL